MPKAWTARFGRSVASHLVDALEERLSGQPTESWLRLGGHQLGSAPEQQAAERSLWEEVEVLETIESDMSTQDLLLGSVFHLVSNPDESTFGPHLTAWGRVATSNFDDMEDDVSLNGTVTTATLGVDGMWQQWLTGVVMAYSKGDGSYSMATFDTGRLKSTLTSFHPYAAYTLNDRVRIWGMLGYGSGTLKLVRDKTFSTDLKMTMGAAGVRGEVLSPSAPGSLTLAIRSDVLWVRMNTAAIETAAGSLAATVAETSRLRVVLGPVTT